MQGGKVACGGKVREVIIYFSIIFIFLLINTNISITILAATMNVYILHFNYY